MMEEKERATESKDTAIDAKELLKELSETDGISGYEWGVAEKVKELLRRPDRRIVDDIRVDALGNLFMHKRGEGGPDRGKILFAAHMDEIGLMIKKIEEDGCLRFASVGWIDQRVLPGQEVIVYGAKAMTGVIGAKPPHLQNPEERKESYKMDDLFIDVGLGGAEASKHVKIGDIAVVKRKVSELRNGILAGKCFDDRAGVAALILALSELSKMRHWADVYCVATVQEEVGLRGATTGTYSLKPDVGIAVDVTHGNMPGVSEFESSELGKGPTIGIGPHVNHKVFEILKELAKEHNIPHQIDPSPYPGGTDAYAIQSSRGGVPSGLLSIPLRYMHTSTETLSIADLKATARLLALFAASFGKETLEGLYCY